MAKFTVNEGVRATQPKVVEAERFGEEGSYTHFYDEAGKIVFSMQTKMVINISLNE